MSLINDALKKARQSQPPSTPAEIQEPLRVATHSPAPRWPMFVVPPLVAIVFAAGTLLVVRGWQGSHKISAREGTVESSSVAEKSPSASVALPAPSNTVNTNSVVPVPTAATFPTLKLQGILWQPSRPSAVINNKSLFIGEKVERAKVTAITEESVTLVWNGEERVLTLP